MRKLMLILALILVVSLVACGGEQAPTGGEGEPAGGGNVDAGQQLYSQSSIGTQAGCTTCHSLEPGVTLVGPSLAKVGAEAGSRVSGLSAEEYVRQSVVEPSAYVVEGFGGGIMPAGYGDALTPEQLDDLVAYLLSLK